MRNSGKGFTVTKAFTLLEMAVVLVIMGLMTTMIIQSQKSAKPSNCYATTQAQMASIQTAIDHFVRTNNYYPAPARRNLGVSNSNFGAPVTTPIESFTNSGTGKTTLYGALPFQAFGLPSSFAADCWGNLFSYIVTRDLIQPGTATTTGYNDPATQGAIIIHSGTYSVPTTIMTNAAYAVISHGETGGQANGGAVPKNNTGAVGWCTGTAHRDNYNCNLQDQLVTATFNNGASAGGNFFDDLIVFAPKALSSCNGRNVPVTWTNASANLSCNGTAAVAAPLGSTPETVTDSTGPNTGSAQFTCAGGQYTTVGTPTCVGPCPTTTTPLTWGSGCSANFGETQAGQDSTVTQTIGAYTGHAQAHCNADGSWGAITPTDSCAPTAPGGNCAATTLHWSDGPSSNDNSNACLGNFPAVADGATTSAVSNTATYHNNGNGSTVPYQGTATATCHSGVLTVNANTSSCQEYCGDNPTCGSSGAFSDSYQQFCSPNRCNTVTMSQTVDCGQETRDYTWDNWQCNAPPPPVCRTTATGLTPGMTDDTTIRNNISSYGCVNQTATPTITKSGNNYAWMCGTNNCSYAVNTGCTWQNVTAFFYDQNNYCGASTTHNAGDSCDASQVGDTDPNHNYGTCTDTGVDTVYGAGDMQTAQHLECFCGAPPASLCPSYNFTYQQGDRSDFVFKCAAGATDGQVYDRSQGQGDGYVWDCNAGGRQQLCHVEMSGGAGVGAGPQCPNTNTPIGNPYRCDVGTVSNTSSDPSQRTCDQFFDRITYYWRCTANGQTVDCMDIESSCP